MNVGCPHEASFLPCSLNSCLLFSFSLCVLHASSLHQCTSSGTCVALSPTPVIARAHTRFRVLTYVLRPRPHTSTFSFKSTPQCEMEGKDIQESEANIEGEDGESSMDGAAAGSSPPEYRSLSTHVLGQPNVSHAVGCILDVKSLLCARAASREFLSITGVTCVSLPDLNDVDGEAGGHMTEVPYTHQQSLALHCLKRAVFACGAFNDQGWGNRKGQVITQLCRGDDVIASTSEPLGKL